MFTRTCRTIGCLKALNYLKTCFYHSFLETRAKVIPENHTGKTFRVLFKYCCMLLILTLVKCKEHWYFFILWEQNISEFADALCSIGLYCTVHYVIVTWIKQWSVALIKMCYCIVRFVLQCSVSEVLITETVQWLYFTCHLVF